MSDLKTLTADIVAAMVANNKVGANELPELIRSIHDSLGALGAEPAEEAPAAIEPAVSVRKSLASPDKIISMIDGKPYSTLKRHLTTHGYTPQSYRQTFGLKADYPMVAPAYTEARRAMAKTIGLGRKPREAAPEPTKPARKPSAKASVSEGEKPARRPRKTLKAALGEAKEHLGG